MLNCCGNPQSSFAADVNVGQYWFLTNRHPRNQNLHQYHPDQCLDWLGVGNLLSYHCFLNLVDASAKLGSRDPLNHHFHPQLPTPLGTHQDHRVFHLNHPSGLIRCSWLTLLRKSVGSYVFYITRYRSLYRIK